MIRPGLHGSNPSLFNPSQSVFDETVEFNERHKSNAGSRRAKVPETSMGFSMDDRIELLKLEPGQRRYLGCELHYRLAFDRLLRD